MRSGLAPGRPESARRGICLPARAAAPRGFHPGAVWIAVAAPVAATLLLLARLAA